MDIKRIQRLISEFQKERTERLDKRQHCKKKMGENVPELIRYQISGKKMNTSKS
jgi:mRNA-degrading endonuclease RelE of RelBE toxin-antitoxin system